MFPARYHFYRENVHFSTLLDLITSLSFIWILVKILPAHLMEPARVIGTPEQVCQMINFDIFIFDFSCEKDSLY